MAGVCPADSTDHAVYHTGQMAGRLWRSAAATRGGVQCAFVQEAHAGVRSGSLLQIVYFVFIY